MRSSSLVELEVKLEVEAWVEVMQLRSNFTFSVRRLEISRVKLISTQVVVEVEVGVELGKKFYSINTEIHIFVMMV